LRDSGKVFTFTIISDSGHKYRFLFSWKTKTIPTLTSLVEIHYIIQYHPLPTHELAGTIKVNNNIDQHVVSRKGTMVLTLSIELIREIFFLLGDI